MSSFFLPCHCPIAPQLSFGSYMNGYAQVQYSKVVSFKSKSLATDLKMLKCAVLAIHLGWELSFNSQLTVKRMANMGNMCTVGCTPCRKIVYAMSEMPKFTTSAKRHTNT